MVCVVCMCVGGPGCVWGVCRFACRCVGGVYGYACMCEEGMKVSQAGQLLPSRYCQFMARNKAVPCPPPPPRPRPAGL